MFCAPCDTFHYDPVAGFLLWLFPCFEKLGIRAAGAERRYTAWRKRFDSFQFAEQERNGGGSFEGDGRTAWAEGNGDTGPAAAFS